MATGTALATAQSNGAVVTAEQFTPDEVRLLKSQTCKDLTDLELKFFLATARRMDLDPFMGEIFAMVYGRDDKRKMTIIPSEIGHLKIAKRDPAYNGIDGPQWCGPDGEWLDFWPFMDTETPPRLPLAARAKASRKGVDNNPWTVVHFWGRAKTYDDGNLKDLWAADPVNQIGKCAVVAALRRSGFTTAAEATEVNIGEGSQPASREIIVPAELTAAPPMRKLTDGKGGPGHADLMSVLCAKIAAARCLDDLTEAEGTWEGALGQPGGIRQNGTSHFALWKLYTKALRGMGEQGKWITALRPTTDKPVPRDETPIEAEYSNDDSPFAEAQAEIDAEDATEPEPDAAPSDLAGDDS